MPDQKEIADKLRDKRDSLFSTVKAWMMTNSTPLILGAIFGGSVLIIVWIAVAHS